MAADGGKQRVEEHLAALDRELERLRRLNAALDERKRRSDAELSELGRRLGESSATLRARFAGSEEPGD